MIKQRKQIGADLSVLPGEDQDDLNRGIYGVGEKWSLLSEVSKTTPECRIGMFRRMRNLTQAELAKAARVRQADISWAEKDIDKVKFGTLRKISNVLGIPLKEILFSEYDEEHSNETL